MKTLGYVRTSTDKQLTDRQIHQLKSLCDKLYCEDGVSSANQKRPVYSMVKRQLKKGDILLVISVDRLFRDTADGLLELRKLQERGIVFKSLSQPFDLNTPDGFFMMTMALALGTWERHILKNRTKEGMEAARRKGKILGRPPKLSDDDLAQAKELLDSEYFNSTAEAANAFRVHEMTLKRALDKVIG